MPRAKPKSNAKPERHAAGDAIPGNAEVLTLAEAAAYLRVPEEEVLRLVQNERLAGRKVGHEWRFLKSAIQAWLSRPQPPIPEQDFWKTQLGAFKDDPDLEDILKEIYERRGRPMTEEG